MISISFPISCYISFSSFSIFARELLYCRLQRVGAPPWLWEQTEREKEKSEMSFSAAVAFFLATWDTELEDELSLKAAHYITVR